MCNFTCLSHMLVITPTNPDPNTHTKECVGLVVGRLEAHAQHGFRCSIGPDDMLFFPRLGAISIDTPERVKYFGLRSMRACGICRVRRGRSLARRASRHVPAEVHDLMNEANAEVHTRPLISSRKRARDKLFRHGWKYNQRCRLNEYAEHCLVDVAEFGPTVYGGLIRYERMHVYFINFCTYLLEQLSELVSKEMFATVARVVNDCHHFRYILDDI
jgi:hypothetical protein